MIRGADTFTNFAPENLTDAECLEHYGLLPCRSCRSVDFVEDFARGDSICGNCGCCAESLFIDDRKLLAFGDEHIPAQAFVPDRPTKSHISRETFAAVHRAKNLPYKRATYFAERISQWIGTEPVIPNHDLKPIWLRRWPKGSKRTCTKQEIRAILADIDTELVSSGQRPRFIRKYLEKWLSIREYLTGDFSTGRYCSPDLAATLKYMFNLIQQPFDTYVREQVGRHNFLNYNFIIRRLLDLNMCSWMAKDFPPLKTTTKQERLIEMWQVVCTKLNWPYINSDGVNFNP